MQDPATSRTPTPRLALGGAALEAAMAAGARAVERHAAVVNALNVFPVPDGDTGLNMSLTLQSAVEAMPGAATDRLDDKAAALARGAVMGARGNSGVILAEFLRGFAHALHGYEELDAPLAATALTEGAEAAYRAVPRPVEGTILSVARAAATAARQAAADARDLVAMLERAHQAAREAVALTPSQLPILDQAGVVDAGGEGFRILLEGLLAHLRGEDAGDDPVPVRVRPDLSSLHEESHDAYGYCTEVVVRGPGVDPDLVRARLEALGSCVLVVGDPALLKVHIHTLRPGAVLDLATDLGELVRVKVDNMQIQHEAFVRSVAAARAPGTTLVAVAVGPGFERLFGGLGAIVVTGGQTMNPSVEQLLDAVERAPTTDAVIVANDANVVLAAHRAAELASGRRVLVLPTRSMPQGIAAALALDPYADASTNLPRLELAATRCQVIELARAIRDARIDEVDVRRGSKFALLNGTAIAAGYSYAQLLVATCRRLVPSTVALASIYWGGEVTPEEAEALGAVLAGELRIGEVVVEHGGQPHYDFLIALE